MPEIIGNHVWDYYEYSIRKKLPLVGSLFKSGGQISDLVGTANSVFGPTVFDTVNRSTNALSLFAKIFWETTGVRLDKSNPATKGYGGADPGAVGGGSGLPTGNIETSPDEFDIGIPGFLHSPYAVTMASAFRSRHDDGLDPVDYKRIRMREVHGQLMNQTWLRDASALYAANTTTNTTDAKNFTGEFGFESLDRIINSAAYFSAVNAGTDTGWFNIYQGITPQPGGATVASTGSGGFISRDASGGTVHDSVIIRPSGATTGFTLTNTGNQPFNLDGVDTMIDTTESNGANPSTQVFLTGYKTRRKFYTELRSAGRFDEMSPAQAKLTWGGLSVTGTHPGRDASFTVRTYQGRPWVADRVTPGGSTADGSVVAGEGAQRLFLADMANIKVQVGIPTLHIGIDNPLIRNEFRNQELYLTALQGRTTRLNTSAKMVNISV